MNKIDAMATFARKKKVKKKESAILENNGASHVAGYVKSRIRLESIHRAGPQWSKIRKKESAGKQADRQAGST